jgi:hypothetical protein
MPIERKRRQSAEISHWTAVIPEPGYQMSASCEKYAWIPKKRTACAVWAGRNTTHKRRRSRRHAIGALTHPSTRI